MVDSVMFPIAEIHQAVVAFEPVGIDHRALVDLLFDYGQQRACRTVFNDLNIDPAFSFDEAEDDLLSPGSTSANASDSWQSALLPSEKFLSDFVG